MKVINPLDKGGYEVLAMESRLIFKKVADLKQAILSSFDQYLQELQFGYVVPGHGKKGKQLEISTANDLDAMYEIYQKKPEILLWMKQCRKHPKLIKLPQLHRLVYQAAPSTKDRWI